MDLNLFVFLLRVVAFFQWTYFMCRDIFEGRSCVKKVSVLKYAVVTNVIYGIHMPMVRQMTTIYINRLRDSMPIALFRMNKIAIIIKKKTQ